MPMLGFPPLLLGLPFWLPLPPPPPLLPPLPTQCHGFLIPPMSSSFMSLTHFKPALQVLIFLPIGSLQTEPCDPSSWAIGKPPGPGGGGGPSGGLLRLLPSGSGGGWLPPFPPPGGGGGPKGLGEGGGGSNGLGDGGGGWSKFAQPDANNFAPPMERRFFPMAVPLQLLYEGTNTFAHDVEQRCNLHGMRPPAQQFDVMAWMAAFLPRPFRGHAPVVGGGGPH